MSKEAFCNYELNDWERSIGFYFDEIAIFEERLREVIQKNTQPEILAATEHFNNVFITQKESLCALKADITQQKEKLEKDFKSIAQFNDFNTVDTQFLLRERMHLFEKLFLEIKHSFCRFLITNPVEYFV